MLKTYFNKNKGITTAVLSNNEMNAVNVVVNRLRIRGLLNDSIPEVVSQQIIEAFDLRKLLMPHNNTGTVQVREGDTFDENTGATLALEKAQKNYMSSFAKSIERWQTSMIKKIYEVNPATFDKALNNAKRKTEKAD